MKDRGYEADAAKTIDEILFPDGMPLYPEDEDLPKIKAELLAALLAEMPDYDKILEYLSGAPEWDKNPIRKARKIAYQTGIDDCKRAIAHYFNPEQKGKQ